MQNSHGAKRLWSESAVKRDQHAQARSGGEVVHDLLDAEVDALLLMNGVAHVPAQGQPLGDVKLHADAARAGEADVSGLNRRAAAQRQVKIEATDTAPQPAHLAVSNGPNEVAHEKLNRVVAGFDDVNQPLLTRNDRVQQTKTLPAAQIAGLEAQIFGEMEGVGTAVGGRAVGQVAREPPPLCRDLMAQRFFDQTRDDAAVSALTDQLLLERFVHALGRGAGWRASHEQGARQQHEQTGNEARHVVPPDIIQSELSAIPRTGVCRQPAQCPNPARSGTLSPRMLSGARSHSTRASLTASMFRSVFVALGMLGALVVRPLAAEPSASSRAQAGCEQESTALGKTACTVAGALAGANEALVVAVAEPNAERVGLSPPSLQRLAQLVAARLGPAARASSMPLSVRDAEQAANQGRGLVYLSAALHRDRLDVSADVYLGAGHFWQRMRAPGWRLSAHGFATSPLDAELRGLFPPIPLVVTRVDKVTLEERDVVALACGDVRGDGSREIATVGRRKIQVGRLERGRFAARASLNWNDFSAIAKSPLREPIAVATVAAPGMLWVGLSDRADGLELSGALGVEHVWHGVMPWPGGGCTRRDGLGYEGLARACPGAHPEPAVDFASPVDAFASRRLTQGDRARTLRVARAVGSDVARALDSLQPEVNVPNVGAQLAVGDLDEDGLPEIVSSSPSLDPRADQLVVRTLTNNGQLRERWRLAVPSGIEAVAICPSDGRASAPLALVTGDGLWLIQ